MNIGDFCDIVYAYAINSPESRSTIRSGLLGYMYEFTEEEDDADMSFDGFKKTALSTSLLDELDAFSG